MPTFNVHPQKELPQNRRVEPSEANEKDAKDLGYTDNSGRAIRNEPSRPENVGSSIVRRNEPDDED